MPLIIKISVATLYELQIRTFLLISHPARYASYYDRAGHAEDADGNYYAVKPPDDELSRSQKLQVLQRLLWLNIDICVRS